MELGRILTDKKWQQILDSIQVGGNNWWAFQNSHVALTSRSDMVKLERNT